MADWIFGTNSYDNNEAINVIGGKGGGDDGKVVLITFGEDILLTKGNALRLAYRLIKHVILESMWL